MSAEELPSSVDGAEPAVAGPQAEGAATEDGGAAPPSSPVLTDSTGSDSDSAPDTPADVEPAANEGITGVQGEVNDGRAVEDILAELGWEARGFKENLSATSIGLGSGRRVFDDDKKVGDKDKKVGDKDQKVGDKDKKVGDGDNKVGDGDKKVQGKETKKVVRDRPY